MNRSQKISQKLLFTIGGIMLLGVAMLIVSMVAMSNISHVQNAQEMQSQVQTWIVILIVFIVIYCALAIFLTLKTAKDIAGPIKSLKETAEDLAAGKLDAKLDYAKDDEIGELAVTLGKTASCLQGIVTDLVYNLHEMSGGNFQVHSKLGDDGYVGDFEAVRKQLGIIKQGISNTMNQITQAADEVAGGAGQVSSGAQALSEGSTQQASSVQQLAATIDEISAKIEENAKNAQEANQQAKEVGSCMTESNKQMEDMISAMNHISETSSKISTIVKTIQDIAFQTNILALNASVEAARAGSAGKGFAVVADEVRNLANKSQEASQNTAKLIEESLSAVEKGTSIANSTAQSLGTAVDGAKNLEETIDKISAASSTQAHSVHQVTESVEQISSVVQTNSATAEESAAASEELSGQAQMLKNMVGCFKLRKTAQLFNN